MLRRFFAMALLVGLSAAHPCSAQLVGALSARGSFLPLYAGDATVGSILSGGLSAQAGLLFGPDGKSEIEVFYTHSPSDVDPYKRHPEFIFAGALATLSGGFHTSFAPFASIGLGFMRVADWDSEEVSCFPPECFAEGGPSFTEGSAPTFLLGGGVDALLVGPARLRADVRVHLPVENSDDPMSPRLEFGFGIRFVIGAGL